MDLFKHLFVSRLVLTGILLLMTPTFAIAASEELRHLKDKMTSLQNQIALDEIEGKDLSAKESQLTKMINKLKRDSRFHPTLLSNLRIESLLKELRENLVAQQGNENRRSLLEEQIVRTKANLDSKLEEEINQLIETARRDFNLGNEAKADSSYHEALSLMEERKKNQNEAILLSPAPPPFGEFILNGNESLDKLREIADFAIHDQENLQKEIKLLENSRRKVLEEIALRKNLAKYQGLLERGDSNTPIQIESIEKELIQFEIKNKILENKLSQIQVSSTLLTKKIREIKGIIHQKEP